MSEQQVLPPMDVTKEDMGPNIPYIGLERTFLSRQNCRERQLRTTLASLAQSEAERERHIRHIMDISIALDVPVGMNAVEYGTHLRAERERLQGDATKAAKELARTSRNRDKHVVTAVELMRQRDEAQIELAREREANQRLRQALDRCVKAGTERNCLIDREYLRVAVSMAQALLEDTSKPVATTS